MIRSLPEALASRASPGDAALAGALIDRPGVDDLTKVSLPFSAARAPRRRDKNVRSAVFVLKLHPGAPRVLPVGETALICTGVRFNST